MIALLIVFFVGIVAFHLLEQLAPVRTEYKSGVTRRGYFADAIHTVVNGPALSALTRITAAWLVTLLPHRIALMSGWSWALQFVVFFLVNDFARYWLHRWYHESAFLWRFHRVHHTVVQMDALSVFRMHVLEAIIKNGVIFLPFQLLGVDAHVIIVYSAWDILKGFWHHANLRTYIGPLNYFLNSAELHWWHHSTEAKGQQSNYGSILSLWDRMFGTFYWPRGRWPEHIGVQGMEAFPDDYTSQFISVRFNDAELIQGLSAQAPSQPPAPAVPPADAAVLPNR